MNTSNPDNLTIIAANLSAQSLGSFDTTYQGDITLDLSISPSTGALTAIKFKQAQLVADNSGSYSPANWDGSTWAPEPETAPANYGGRLSAFVNFATRDLALSVSSGDTTFNVAPNGEFTANQGAKFEFIAGFNELYGPALDSDSHDPLVDLKNYEIDTNVLQPNGTPYPGGIVWRTVTGVDGNNRPIYGPLANAFVITGGSSMPEIYDPDNGTQLGQPDAVKIFDAQGVHEKLAFNNNSARVSSITATFDASNPADVKLNVALEYFVDAPSAFFVGDFAVGLKIGEGFDVILGEPIPGKLVASASVSLLPGDVNFDGVVDIFDVAQVSNNWGSAGTPGQFLSGDANWDGVVDIFDVAQISNNWGATGSNAAAVPEPATIGLVFATAMGCFVMRRRLWTR